ncbi:hypothetical protein [Flavobacterium muglaense]|uniref:YhhN-like protein n=1 Tax=Flavobacterium muglaense TaxID=2764716 RepID=A0A923N2R9_9FLAO|nr:hypothetical protein [Flavobacterium muglaense]MBC5839249.1 hypothetical protein [Flavobacterium muglaense]MBC5845745.1 hypothetical protein [Flavobacterium muglaense]
MKVFSKETTVENALIVFYFLVACMEVVFQIFLESHYQYAIKVIEVVILVALYWYSSTLRSPIYFVNMVLLLIGRLFFISPEIKMLRYALIAVFFHRLIEIYYVAKLIKLKDYIPPILASIPFLMYFLYLVSIPESVLIESYIILIVNILLISALSGIILSQYLLIFNKKDIWLFVSGMMSLTQTFIIFIEKFYLADLELISLRPMALLLNTAVCFAFYKFVVASERLNND